MAHIPTEVRRQQFIDAAVTVIARDGVDGATTRRIAEEAGAPLATLHYCFQTKENLLSAVFEHIAETVRIDVEQAGTAGKSVAAIARELLIGGVHWAIERPVFNRAQFEMWLWTERNDPELAIKVYDLYIESWEEFLRAARNPLPEDQLESVTRVIVGLADGFCMQLVTHGDEKKVLREVETASAMLDAFLGRRARRTA